MGQRRRRAIVIVVVLAVAAAGTSLLLQVPSEPKFPMASFTESITVAAPDDALTFARVKIDGEPRLLGVREYSGGQMQAVDLTTALNEQVTDPIDAFARYGYDGLRQQILNSSDELRVSVAVEDLLLPVQLTDAHVAAATNFTAHADEADVTEGPFLFPKLVRPTISGSTVSVGEALLDYEVELAFVTLDSAAVSTVPEFLGVVLANDLTDRSKLMRHIDPDDVTSGKGFATGKGVTGYLPVGNLFVIPRDFRTFVGGVHLNLAVNGRLRQSAGMELAIWDIDELFPQMQQREQTQWDHLGQQVGLPIDDGQLPARTLILCGTPAGTIFRGVHPRDMARGVMGWLFGGWGQSVKRNVIEAYIGRASAAGFYLQEGDHVAIQVDGLGECHIDITR